MFKPRSISAVIMGTVILNPVAYASDKKIINPDKAACRTHKVYCHILKLRPKIDKNWALQFSNLLYRYGKRYKMDPMRSLAIAMQETSLKNKNRAQKIIVFKKKCKEGKCENSFETVEGFSDLSIFQFHVETIKYFDIDPIKLTNSLEYAVDTHYKILKYKQNICADLQKNAWACYHSKTPKYQKKYIKMVNRWYPKI